MATWVPFTDATFQNALPLDFQNQHTTWVAINPAKASRLTEIVTAVRNTFRSAVASNPTNVLDPNATTVPATGEEYAFVMAAYKLGLEIGMTSVASPQGRTVVNLVVTNSSSGGLVPMGGSSGSTATGLNFLDELGRRIVRAEIWLRMVQSGIIPIAAEGTSGGTPSFARPEGAGEKGAGAEEEEEE